MDATVKKTCWLILFILAWPLGAGAWSGKITGIIDGDSLRIMRPGFGEVELRLYGIDAPEFKQAFGRAAKKHLASVLSRHMATIKTLDRDKHGRSVVILWQNGRNVNEIMVRDGYAWVYRRYCRESFCHDWLRFEKDARLKKLGLWQEEEPVPPWEFRHME